MAGVRLYNLYVLTVLGLGGFTYGFGFSVFVTAVGQPGFYSYFKLDPASTYAANIIGAVNALFTAGAAFGSLAQPPIADRYGRRMALATASLCSLIGGALAAGSVHIAMLIVVRITQGFGLGMLLALVPLYLSEIAAPRQRGLVTGVTVLSFGTGFSVCAWIAVGTYYANQTVQWRVPLALACASPLLMLIALLTIPETPRYLIWNGRKEQAWSVLRRLHHDPNDPEARAANAEFTQIVLQVEHDKENGGGFVQLFKKPTLRKRALLVIFATWASVSTGVIGISAYLPLIFSGLGLEGVLPLVMYGVWTTIGTLGVALAISIVDRVGRRIMLVVGYPLMAVLLLSESLLQNRYLGSNDRGGLAACLLFLLMFIVTYQCVDAPTIIWIAEIWPIAYRAKGISLGLCSYFVASLTYTTPSALAFKNIGWHMYLLYMGLCVICFVIVYFFIQETKDLPMEELAALFGDEVVVHITKDGKAITEDKELDNIVKSQLEQVHAEDLKTKRTAVADETGARHIESA